jgi:predicted DNA-binding protein YlxM (UPF0122 family)
MQAVITADIVNSTKLTDSDFQKLIQEIRLLFKSPDKIEFYRGDGFQVLISDAQEAVVKLLLIRLTALRYSGEFRIDVRQSVRLGKVATDIKDLGSHIDDTFLHSGRIFDTFGEADVNDSLIITCGNKRYDFVYQLIADYLDTLIGTITVKQAEVLNYHFDGMSQKDIASELKKSTATVSNQIKVARTMEIERLINRFKLLTIDLRKNGK